MYRIEEWWSQKMKWVRLKRVKLWLWLVLWQVQVQVLLVLLLQPMALSNRPYDWHRPPVLGVLWGWAPVVPHSLLLL